MCIISLNDYEIKRLRRESILAGKKPIGRGAFSVVFEGTRPNTVLKLTADPTAYALLNDGVAKVSHWHYPRVVKNYFCVADVRLGDEEVPVWLYEVERLQHVKGKDARLATQIADWVYAKRVQTALERAENLPAAPHLPRSIYNAVKRLQDFFMYFEQARLDFCRTNIMQRANGDIVLNDVVFDRKLLDVYRNVRWGKGR